MIQYNEKTHIYTDDDIRQGFEWTLEQAKKTGKEPCLDDGEVIW